MIAGEAVVDPSIAQADQHTGYLGKYVALIERLGADPAGFAVEYVVPIRITPTRLRQWRVSSGG